MFTGCLCRARIKHVAGFIRHAELEFDVFESVFERVYFSFCSDKFVVQLLSFSNFCSQEFFAGLELFNRFLAALEQLVDPVMSKFQVFGCIFGGGFSLDRVFSRDLQCGLQITNLRVPRILPIGDFPITHEIDTHTECTDDTREPTGDKGGHDI